MVARKGIGISIIDAMSDQEYIKYLEDGQEILKASLYESERMRKEIKEMMHKQALEARS